MKKVYMIPATQVVKVETNYMMVGTSQTINVGNEYDGGAVLSREADSLWGDEE
jgi:hypothetical protein